MNTTFETMQCLEDNLVAAYVAHALGDDERQRVTEHLSTCDVCLAITCAAIGSDDAAPDEPARIAGYVLLEMIGEGRLGAVYAARDTAQDRRVTLKVLKSDRLRDRDARARIVREVRASAQLRHPHVLPIYEAGELDDGVFVATEPSDDVTLAQWLAAPDRRWQDVLRMFRAAGAGLAAAHAAGLAHGGFTPECVRVRGDDVVVADFGLAAFAAETDASERCARYRAPEQLLGARSDARADQYGFARALYEALHDDVPPAGSTEAPRRIRRALDRALAPSPDKRFASMAELLDELRASWPRRTTTLAAIAAAGALVAGLVVTVAPRSAGVPPIAPAALSLRPPSAAADDDLQGQRALAEEALRAERFPVALEVARAAARRDPRNEPVRRDLLLAELGNERFTDVVRDGGALVAETSQPAGAAIAAIAAAHALLGHRTDAAGMIKRLAQLDPELAPRAAADLAAYDARLDDAVEALRGRASAAEQVALAAVWLRRGDLRAARLAAARATGDASVPVAYLAASLAIAAGDPALASRTAPAWRGSPDRERRRYAELLTGDLLRAQQRWSEAAEAYRASARLGDGWLAHDRLARAAIGARDWTTAERELMWCLDHRGQAALVASPSLALLPEVYLALARVRDARHAAPSDVRAAYRAVAELGTAAQRDPWTDEARQRLTELPR